jgi:sigma-B regulation protein RsbU (phosphoserine phosphatase)
MRSIWHNMPRRSFVTLLAAVFMTFLPIGFLIDVYSLGASSPARLLAVVACVRYDQAAGLEFSLAGHLPILHYRAATGTVVERSIAHLPIAMFEASRYSSEAVPCAAGDLFVLMTDGLTEVFDAADVQLGLDPLKETVRAGARLPLPLLFDALIATARGHGEQTDDQTILLVRAA